MASYQISQPISLSYIQLTYTSILHLRKYLNCSIPVSKWRIWWDRNKQTKQPIPEKSGKQNGKPPPWTLRSEETSVEPTMLLALHVYKPALCELTLGSRRLLTLGVKLLMMVSWSEATSWLSLYHWSLIGSSPSVTKHDICKSFPDSTSSGNEKGRISGLTVESQQHNHHLRFIKGRKLWPILSL